MKHYGDICRMNGADVERVECVIGGSPCQDLSVAGKRAGLAGERSGLFMEQIRLIKEMRARDEADGRTGIDVFPRFMVWENVYGAFSSNGGEDFRAVLEEVAKVADKSAAIPKNEGGAWRPSGVVLGDGWSIAWRTHDAQYWGVPQRRRRISLVADFNGQTAPWITFDCVRREADLHDQDAAVGYIGGESGPEVQFIAESLFGDSAESSPAREALNDAGNPDSCAGATGGCITFRNHYDGRIVNDQSLTLDTCGGG